MLVIGTHSFKSQEDAKKYIRSLLSEVGCCSSVKSKNGEVFNVFMELIKRHPDGESKIHDVVDFAIQYDKMNKTAFMLSIIRSDGEVQPISWIHCITGKHKSPKDMLNSALRSSIGDQILTFKSNMQSTCCEFCTKNTPDYHIDHVVQFIKLTTDFLKINESHPTEFAPTTDGTNRLTFRMEDQEFSDAWSEYHKEHAVLRVLCKSCNLKREKYKI